MKKYLSPIVILAANIVASVVMFYISLVWGIVLLNLTIWGPTLAKRAFRFIRSCWIVSGDWDRWPDLRECEDTRIVSWTIAVFVWIRRFTGTMHAETD